MVIVQLRKDFYMKLDFLKVFLVVILKTPLTIPDRPWTYTPAKIGANVSISVGILLDQVIVLPSNGTQFRSDIVISNAKNHARGI